MPTVAVEMTPLEFLVNNSSGGDFHPHDIVELTGNKGTLRGNIFSVRPKILGANREPGFGIKVAINDGKVSNFSSFNSFKGYTITKKGGGPTGMIRPPYPIYPAKRMNPKELQGMLDMGLELINRAAKLKFSDPAARWFGAEVFETGKLDQIHRRCVSLCAGCDGLKKVIFQCDPSETLGAIDTADPLRNGPICRIKLGRGFTYDRYSWGERVCTIVHELTHWFLNTVDAKLADGSDCYGLNCIRLAKSFSKVERQKALNNADNWAYYICQYRSATDPGDWRNFTEEEINARGPFVSGGYNVVPELIAFNS